MFPLLIKRSQMYKVDFVCVTHCIAIKDMQWLPARRNPFLLMCLYVCLCKSFTIGCQTKCLEVLSQRDMTKTQEVCFLLARSSQAVCKEQSVLAACVALYLEGCLSRRPPIANVYICVSVHIHVSIRGDVCVQRYLVPLTPSFPGLLQPRDLRWIFKHLHPLPNTMRNGIVSSHHHLKCH